MGLRVPTWIEEYEHTETHPFADFFSTDPEQGSLYPSSFLVSFSAFITMNGVGQVPESPHFQVPMQKLQPHSQPRLPHFPETDLKLGFISY